jgi:hypothetical protein
MASSPGSNDHVIARKSIHLTSDLIFYVVTIFFILMSVLLICLGFYRLYLTVIALPDVRLDFLFEGIGFITVASAVFELARTMLEEEILSKVRMNAPRKIRHFISRFMTVIVISLSIELLTMVFRYSHRASEFNFLYNASAVAAGIALVFTSWAIFNRISVRVEEWETRERELGEKRENK